MGSKAAKSQYRRDVRKLKATNMKQLAAKVSIGGNVGSSAMSKLCHRDLEMNKDAYLEAKLERDAIKAKRYASCNLCGGWKLPQFRICSKCNKLKASNATK